MKNAKFLVVYHESLFIALRQDDVKDLQGITIPRKNYKRFEQSLTVYLYRLAEVYILLD